LKKKKKKNQIIPFLFSQKKKHLNPKKWRNFPKKLAKLVELFDTRKTKKIPKFCPCFLVSKKNNNTVTGRPCRSAPYLTYLFLSLPVRTRGGWHVQRMHVSGTAGVTTTYRVWITMQMDGEDGSGRTDNGWMGWIDSEGGFV
jgi:hypothetical protein